MDHFETIQVSQDQNTLKIVLNRPHKANAMNDQMIREIMTVLTDLKSMTDKIHYLIITGSGRHFSAGADMVESAELLNNAADLSTTIKTDLTNRIKFMNLIEDADQMTIAVINGPAYGAGFALAMACDFRIASTSAEICLPEAELGLFFSGGCTPRLVQLVGQAKAKEMLLLCSKVDADEAVRIGLVTQAVDDDKLDGHVNDLIVQLEKSSLAALQVNKQLIQNAHPNDDHRSQLLESHIFEWLMSKNNVQAQMAGFNNRN